MRIKMLVILVLISIFISLAVCYSTGFIASAKDSRESSKKTQKYFQFSINDGFGMDEAVIDKILKKSYATTRLYEGGDSKWSGSYIVEETVRKYELQNNMPKVKVSFTPKQTLKEEKEIFYKITTSNGKIEGMRKLQPGEYIYFETDRPIPDKKSNVYVEISQSNWFSNRFNLKDKLPDEIISPETAFKIAAECCKKSFNEYPNENYVFNFSYINDGFWMVTFDDSSGYLSYLLIDAYTGETDGDIKQEE